MATQRTLVRGGHVLSMDPAIGELPQGDVLIEDGVITAVAPSLGEVDAEVIDATGHIVAPGLIDTHRHTWQTQMRALCADWTLTDYLFGIRFSVSPAYAAEDVHLGNLLGAVDALESGRDDDPGLLALQQHARARRRRRHRAARRRDPGGVRLRASSRPARWPRRTSPTTRPRLRTSPASPTPTSLATALLTLGVALTEVGVIPLSATAAEVAAARERSAILWSPTPAACGHSRTASANWTRRACSVRTRSTCTATPSPTTSGRSLARDGAKVSISVETELNMGMGRPAFAACERHGIAPTLSCDIVSLNSGDLFSQIRQGLGFKRWADTEALNLAGGDPDRVSTTALEALRWSTVNAAEAIGLGDRIGSLTPGKQADLIIVGGPGTSQHPHPRRGRDAGLPDAPVRRAHRAGRRPGGQAGRRHDRCRPARACWQQADDLRRGHPGPGPGQPSRCCRPTRPAASR